MNSGGLTVSGVPSGYRAAVFLTWEDHGTSICEDSKLDTGDLRIPSLSVARDPVSNLNWLVKVDVI